MGQVELTLSRVVCRVVVTAALTVWAAAALAQTPNVAEFLPPPEHSHTSNGQPVVSRYDLLIYQAGAASPYVQFNLGKPNPQTDGLIRVDFSSQITVWPMPNTPSEARVVAVGPAGMGVSLASSSFIYSCGVQLSSTSQLFTSAGGSGSVQVTTTSKCGWGATSPAPWITITSTTKSGTGTLTYTVASNPTSGSRTATFAIAGTNYTVTQGGTAGGSSPAQTRYLSDLSWTSATNGWGPVERNKSNGESGQNDGRALTLNGRTYAKGLGVHARSEIFFSLDGTCSTFQADLGVDDEVSSNGSVVFQVWGDGRLLADSGVMTGNSQTLALTTLITGVRQLRLLVSDGGNGMTFDHADWADARVNCASSAPSAPQPTFTYLSDRSWTSVTNGWGPVELDATNGDQKADDGGTITLNGITYTKGLGAHSHSEIRYALNGLCTTFAADVGVDDEVGTGGSIVFQVFADGTKLFDSGTMTGATATKAVQVSVTGKQELVLVITNAGDNRNNDHGDWANARISCATTATASSIGYGSDTGTI